MSEIHSEIQMGILNYLAVNPKASASAQDIQDYWLANERSSHNIEQVQTALDRLVDRGELTRKLGNEHYAL